MTTWSMVQATITGENEDRPGLIAHYRVTTLGSQSLPLFEITSYMIEYGWLRLLCEYRDGTYFSILVPPTCGDAVEIERLPEIETDSLAEPAQQDAAGETASPQ